MGTAQFYRSIKRIALYRGGHRLRALGRHLTWQIRRHRQEFPYDITLTQQSKLQITTPDAVNGCAALAWSLQRYDFDNMAFLQDILSRSAEPMTVFDVGANVGVYSLLTSEANKNRVHAFEPHPATAALLRNNLMVNQRTNVSVHCCALSENNGELSFTDDPGSTVNQLIPQAEPLEPASNSTRTITIPTLRGDTFCQQNNTTPDIMKVDVEGHEAEVLRGFGTVLESVKMILVEENISSTTLLQLLPAGRFEYYFVDFKRRVLHQREGVSNQDVAFINTDFVPALRALGYTLEPKA